MFLKRFETAVRAALLALFWAVTVAAVAVAEAEAPLPVEAFFADRPFSNPRLSPNGEQLAMLYSQDGVQMVVVRPALGGQARIIGRIADPEIRLIWLEWANDDRILFSVEARNHQSVGVRGRLRRLLGIDRDGGNMKYLGDAWPHRVQYEDRILHWLPDQPHHVLVHYRAPTSEWPTVQKLDVRTGQLRAVQTAEPKIRSWHIDHDGRVRAGSGWEELRYRLFARSKGRGSFDKIEDFYPYKEDGMQLVDFSYASPQRIYVAREVGGRRGIFEYDLATGKLGEAVFKHGTYDAGDLVFDHRRRRLVAVEYAAEGPELHFLDETAEKEQQAVDQALPGAVNRVVSRSDDGNRAVVRSGSDTRAPEYYLFLRDTEPKRLEILLELYPKLVGKTLPGMRPVSYKARDGLTVPAYLTIPLGQEPRNLPVVVLPHGGPSSRDVQGFEPEVQWLASRGFAVFQPNFRGSTGYGTDHLRRGYRQWGQAMQDDITDGVKWLIEEGIADPDRIGIYGSSYGGYAALMALVKTPELFRAGASYAGVTDLLQLLDDSEWYLGNEHNRPQIGGGWSDRDRLKATSPARRAEEIRAPVLLAHGEDDPIVHIRQSERMAKALKRAGKDVEFLSFEHEAHGFLLEENRLKFYRKLADFFERELAPKQETRRK